MDSIDFDNVKAEKVKAMRRYNRFRRIGHLFRTAEICVALLFVCWTFTRLPFVVRISGEFLRRLATVISTPLFVFLLGNSIVIVLLTKSTTASSAETEVYQAFVRSVESRAKPYDEDSTDEIVYDDKQVIVTDCDSNSNLDAEIDSDLDPVTVSDQPKVVYQRSKSDISAKQSPEMVTKRSLQRSETEKYRKTEDESNENEKEKEDKKNYPEDNLSNEEFQKTIEAFIAKQLMFRRQESLAVVVHNKA